MKIQLYHKKPQIRMRLRLDKVEHEGKGILAGQETMGSRLHRALLLPSLLSRSTAMLIPCVFQMSGSSWTALHHSYFLPPVRSFTFCFGRFPKALVCEPAGHPILYFP